MHPGQQFFHGIPSEPGASGTYRIQNHGDPPPIGFPPGQNHGLYTVDGSHVADKRLNLRNRLFHLQWMTRHGGTSAGGQNDIGAVVDGHKIGNALHQRFSLPYRRQNLFKLHTHRSSSARKRSRTLDRFKTSSSITPMIPPTTAEGV